MPTKTIRLSDDLKARVADAAKRAGTTADNFIVEAISEKLDQDVPRNNFHDEAEKRYANIVSGGKTISWNQMRTFLEDRVAGEKVVRPPSRCSL